MTHERCPRCIRWRRRLALEMREAGKTFSEIGEVLEISGSAAHKLYMTGLKYRAQMRERQEARNVHLFKRRRAA